MAIAVDAHVHLHEAEPDLFAIARRLRIAAREPVEGGALLLADIGAPDGFRRVRALPGVRLLSEVNGLTIDTPDLPLLIVAGRQVVTAEGVEVLVHASMQAPVDGLPAAEVLAWARRHGRYACLPWGFGKWLGARRRTVRGLLDDHPGLAVGDVSTRPGCWPDPLLRPPEYGRPVWRGTDPLPVAGDADRIGRFGQVVRVPGCAGEPVAELMRALCDPRAVRPFGQRLGAMTALRLQLAFRRERSPCES